MRRGWAARVQRQRTRVPPWRICVCRVHAVRCRCFEGTRASRRGWRAGGPVDVVDSGSNSPDVAAFGRQHLRPCCGRVRGLHDLRDRRHVAKAGRADPKATTDGSGVRATAGPGFRRSKRPASTESHGESTRCRVMSSRASSRPMNRAKEEPNAHVHGALSLAAGAYSVGLKWGSTRIFDPWGRWDSNPGPPPCKGPAPAS